MLKEIQKELKDAGISVSDEDIQNRLDTLKRFKVPENEVKRSVLTKFGLKSNVSQEDNQIEPISALTKEGTWTSLKIKVVQLWDNNHESISQTGVVGDETGTVKFTAWASAKLPILEEGMSYTLLNVVTSVYNEKMQVSLNKKSKVENAEDVEVKDNTVTIIGALVSVNKGSGLITRCNVCNKSIRGSCPNHADAEGHHDLRIIGVIDSGKTCTTVIINAEVVESLSGFTVESSRQMATEALDKEVVGDALEKMLIGKFFYVSGPDMGDTMLAKTMMPYVKAIPDDELSALIKYIKE